jgi:hypothetical protein
MLRFLKCFGVVAMTSGLVFILMADDSKAQCAAPVTAYYPAQPVVSYVPERVGLFGLRTAYRPVVSYAAPVVAAPVTSYYAPAAPVTTYYAPAAPVTTYYAPAAPVTTYYAPAAPVTTYYAPAAPVTSYYAPAAPVTTYYAPSACP